MEMTNHEIVQMYKNSADKKKQITILAEMNLCTPEAIRDELVKGGVDPRTLPRKRRKPGEKQAEEATAVPETAPTADAAPLVFAQSDAELIREALLFYAGDITRELSERREEVKSLESASVNISRIVDSIDKTIGRK